MSPIMPDQPSRPTSSVELDKLRRRLEGYVYVIKFSSGTVKVGQTSDPGRRFSEHAKAAQVHGRLVTQSWVSTPHVEVKANEDALISYCAERWEESGGRESFANADYLAVVEYAQGLPYARPTAAELMSQLARHNRIQARWDDARQSRATAIRLTDVREKVALMAPLVNDENRWAASNSLFNLAKQVLALTPPAWAEEDPTAAERYLAGRGADSGLVRQNAAEFELNYRTLYAIRYQREASAFEDIARYCDAMTAGPQQQDRRAS